jgi:hypothetical protein
LTFSIKTRNIMAFSIIDLIVILSINYRITTLDISIVPLLSVSHCLIVMLNVVMLTAVAPLIYLPLTNNPAFDRQRMCNKPFSAIIHSPA